MTNNKEQEMNLPAVIEQDDNTNANCGERPECHNCQKVWEFDYTTLNMEHEGIYMGDTVPLIPDEELSETLGIHAGTLPLHLTLHCLPVYSVGDNIYIDPNSVKFMLQAHNICLADIS